MSYMGFMGKYKHTLDAKNRMFIPVKYREALGENFIITRAPKPLQSLYIFPAETWSELCAQLDNTQLSETSYWERRVFCMYADEVSMDKQGRITINQDLCGFAQLKEDIIVVGNLKHLEIWDKEVFERTLADAEARGVVGTPNLNF